MHRSLKRGAGTSTTEEIPHIAEISETTKRDAVPIWRTQKICAAAHERSDYGPEGRLSFLPPGTFVDITV